MEERTYCVYKHTNRENGKCYIGITSQNVRIRWNRGWGYQQCPHFGRAIQKYGWDSFDHEILLDGLTKDEAEAQEVQLIARYRSAEPEFGYNTSLGGKGTGKHSEETKIKLGNVRRGAHHTEEAKRKLSEAHTGKTLSEEHIAKLKVAQFGGKHHRARGVCQYTLDGEFVARFDCISDAARKVEAPNQNIVKCCQGKRSQAKGYRWKYA